MDIEKLTKMALNKDSNALRELADYYFYEADSKDYKLAALNYYNLANLDDPYGCYSIGYCYLQGLGVEQNLEEAIDWFKKASLMEEASSTLKLGEIYYFGEYFEPDYDLAYEYFEKIFNYSSAAKYYGARIILEDKTSNGNIDLGLELMYSAANDQFVPAISFLAKSNIQGSNYVKKNVEKGISYLKKGLDLRDPFCICKLGEMLFYGIDIDQDVDLGLELLEESANMGYHAAYVFLGDIYAKLDNKKFKQINVKKDIEKAINYYELAYNQGNIYACCRLADYYYLIGDEKNYIKYMNLGFDYDNGECAYNVCLAYLFGTYGKEENKEKALEALEFACSQDIPLAIKLMKKVSKSGLKAIKKNDQKKYYKELKKNIYIKLK